MRIDFFTTQPNAACSMFYSSALKRIPEVALYDTNVSAYDVILVMTYDHKFLGQIRAANPKAKIGVVDPRNHEVLGSTKYCDFIVIDSIEMEDYWTIANKPIFRYAEYPDIPTVKKSHKKSNSIKVGYHGNQIHLECMSESVTPALSRLSEKHDIELVVMYNGSPPRGDESWIPRGVKVRHVPWSMESYLTDLADTDIGLVPNNIIHDSSEKSLNTLNRKYNYSSDDYSLRFKMPSNPGRFIVFGKLGIPVVADFYPSALQYLREDLCTGMVACNPSGWEKCLDRLMESEKLRQDFGDGLQNLVEEKFDFEKQNQKFLNFLNTL